MCAARCGRILDSADDALVVAQHACTKSAIAVSCSMPNMDLTSEKTRSEAAELGARAKMMRAALAHVGNWGLYARHHVSSASV